LLLLTCGRSGVGEHEEGKQGEDGEHYRPCRWVIGVGDEASVVLVEKSTAKGLELNAVPGLLGQGLTAQSVSDVGNVLSDVHKTGSVTETRVITKSDHTSMGRELARSLGTVYTGNPRNQVSSGMKRSC
jgi:hypothetical protein